MSASQISQGLNVSTLRDPRSTACSFRRFWLNQARFLAYSLYLPAVDLLLQLPCCGRGPSACSVRRALKRDLFDHILYRGIKWRLALFVAYFVVIQLVHRDAPIYDSTFLTDIFPVRLKIIILSVPPWFFCTCSRPKVPKRR